MSKVLDLIAVIFSLTCVSVVLVTLLACMSTPDGRWAVDANGKGEMLIEVIIVSGLTPFTAWRLIRRK